jgi:hypothetical protein
MIAKKENQLTVTDGPIEQMLGLWEEVVAALGHKLRMKYGLRDEPTEAQVRAWLETTQAAIRRGADRERAGDEAARALFPTYRTHIYAPEADTIEMLLREAEGK